LGQKATIVKPLIIDPTNYDKKVALDIAVPYVEAFLDLNGIKHVTEYLWVPDETKKPPGKNPWHDKGFYWCGTLFVNVKKTRVPVKVPGFQWSFTGYKSDLTAPGVLAHETGHHVHFELEKRGAKIPRMMADCLRYLQANEAPVSGYEPNLHELMAEAMRLFILNPKLLEEGRPERHRFLTGHLNLKPLHQEPWRSVLQHAHPKVISAAEGWIKRCTST
jgi:hypothetical protein